MRLNSSGHLLLGTTTDEGALTVNSGSSNTCATFKSTDAGAGINLKDNNARSSIEQNGTDLKISSDTGAEDANSTIKLQVDASTKMTINSSGNVGIGTTSPSNKLHVTTTSGEAAALRVQTVSANTNQEFVVFFRNNTFATGGIRRDGNNAGPAFFTSSDRRLKTNIVDMDNVLNKIKQLSIKKFDYKDGTASGIGLIAQDLINIFPNKVTKDDSDDGTGDTIPDGVEPWTVGHNFTFELLKAVQELIARVESLEAA